jgi:hypothetical protein
VAKVKPFVVDSGEQFLSKGPRALTSGAYTKEYNEVKQVGAVGSTRTPEQQALVDFFQANPVEMYSRVLRTQAAMEGLDLAQQARLFARVPGHPLPLGRRAGSRDRARRRALGRQARTALR